MLYKSVKPMTIAAAMALALLAAPASAKVCSEQVYQGKGSGAKPDAIVAAKAEWTMRVKADLGSQWANWNVAVGKNISCSSYDASLKLEKCNVSARPCTVMKVKVQQYEPNKPFIK